MIDVKNKVLFIHVPRTGGSALENAYYKEFLSDQITYDDFLNEYVYFNHQKAFPGEPGKHWTYAEYSSAGLIEDVNEWHVFTIIRNTFDLVWSNWYLVNINLRRNNQPEFDWNEYIQQLRTRPALRDNINQSRYIYGADNVEIIMFENLTQDVKRVVNVDLPKIFNNDGYKDRQTHYTQSYDDRSIKLVKAIYAEDIERYKFTYDD